jgi:hypothetical protein
MVFVLSNWPGMLIPFRRGAEEMSKSLRATSGECSETRSVFEFAYPTVAQVRIGGSLNESADEIDLYLAGVMRELNLQTIGTLPPIICWTHCSSRTARTIAAQFTSEERRNGESTSR